jgi:hypothetical protein
VRINRRLGIAGRGELRFSVRCELRSELGLELRVGSYVELGFELRVRP